MGVSSQTGWEVADLQHPMLTEGQPVSCPWTLLYHLCALSLAVGSSALGKERPCSG